MHPGVIQACVWSFVLGMYVLQQDLLSPVSLRVFLVVLAGVLTFSLGAYTACRGFRAPKQPVADLDFEPKAWIMNVLVWLPIIGLIPFLATVIMLGSDGPFEAFFQNLRSNIGNVESRSGGGAFGVWAYLIPISFASIGVQVLLERYRTHRTVFIVSFLVALVYAFFTTGRSFVLLLLLMVAGILLITRRVSAVKTAAVAVSVGLVVFLGLGLLVNKGGTIVGGAEIEIVNLWRVFLVYLLGPLPALDIYLQTSAGAGSGEHVFRTIYAVLAFVGLDVEVPPLVQDYVLIPFPTNVYTFFQPYYTDFGLAGVILAPFLFGWLHGALYRRASMGHLFSIMMYALLLYALVFQFFQDHYFSLLSTWIQYTIILGLFFYRFHVLAPAPEELSTTPSAS